MATASTWLTHLGDVLSDFTDKAVPVMKLDMIRWGGLAPEYQSDKTDAHAIDHLGAVFQTALRELGPITRRGAMPRHFTTLILIGMLLGIVVGYACHEAFPDAKTAAGIAGYISLVTDLFLRLIKMIIAPLVLSTLIVGIAHMGSGSSLGRIGLKTMGWFITASLVSLLLGLLMVNLLQPGVDLGLPIPDAGSSPNLKTSGLTLKEFVTHLVPKSIVEAMANNEILQIVVFAIFSGVAIASLGERAKPLEKLIEQVSHMMLEITSYVMKAAPLAVFAAIAATVTTNGLGILVTFGKFMGGFYLSLVILWLVIFGAGFLVVGPRAFRLAHLVREPILLAFSTASSEAAYPKTLERLEQFGVPNRIASFVLPLGYSFNLDGSMMYCTFATLFIAQAYGITLGAGEQITMLLLLMLTSKGMAGVPRASLVVISATLSTFNIPEAGLLLIMGIDQFLDMGRSATNVVGNSVAAAVISKWEGNLRPEQPGVDEGATLEHPIPAPAPAE
jgi:Na+/H+-dicarboxylate symporter